MATWKEKAEAERAALKAAQDKIEANREEIEGREEYERTKAEREAADRVLRDLDLARRLEALQDANPGARYEVVCPDTWPDTFIVRYDAAAHAKWEASVDADAKAEARGKNGKHLKVDMVKAQRDYAVAVIEDWNGLTDFDTVRPFGADHRPPAANAAGGKPSTGGAELNLFLTENAGIVTPIVGAAARLAGFFAEARKS